MIFQQINVGGTKNFGYYICDEQARVAAFVDPSFAPEKFIVMAEEMNAKVQYVFNTHGHEDHTNGNETVQKRTGAKVVGFDVKGRGTLRVEEGAELALGDVTIRVLHTPGHTEDSICLQVGSCLLTGDTLYVGKVGSTPLADDAKQLFKSLHRLMELPDASEIYPGHDFGVRPFSTLRNEKDNNPFLVIGSFNEFVLLKRYWAQKETPHI